MVQGLFTYGGAIPLAFPLAISLALNGTLAAKEGPASQKQEKRQVHPAIHGDDPEISEFTDYVIGNDISAYPTYDGYLRLLRQFAREYPEECRVEEVGKSLKGRSILAVCLHVAGEASGGKKPKVFITGALRGNCLNGSIIMLNYISKYLKAAESDEKVKKRLARVELWVAPFCNPDGTYRGGNHTVLDATHLNAGQKDLLRDYPVAGAAAWSPQPETEALVRFEKEKRFDYYIDFIDGISAVICPWGYTKQRPPHWEWMLQAGKEGYAKTAGISFGQLAVDWYSGGPGTRLDWKEAFMACRGFWVSVWNRGAQGPASLQFRYRQHVKAIDGFLDDLLCLE